MTTYAVTIPFHVHIYIDTDDPESLTDDEVFDALIEQVGKYPAVDAREMGDDWEVLGEV